MALLSSFIHLLLYLLVALLSLHAFAAPSKPDALSPRQDIVLSPRGQSPSTISGSQPKGTRPSRGSGQIKWNSTRKNKKEREGPEDVGENKVDVEDAELPDVKDDKIKKDPDGGKGPDVCNAPCAGECCDAGKQGPNEKESNHPKDDWFCKFMIGQWNQPIFTTCCPLNEMADKNGRCCLQQYLDPNTGLCCTKKNKKKCAVWN